MRVFATLYQHRRLLQATVLQGLKARTSGSVFGAVWLVIYPLLFLLMYALVFAYILKVRLPGLGTADYVLTIFCGLVPFLALAEAFGIGTSSLVSNRGLLRNTLFPVELVVARDVLVGHASMGLGMLLVWGACIYGGHLYLSHFAFPLIFLLQIVMVLGLVWITATLTIFFRDLQQATPIIILFMMLVSPIAYTDDMVPAGLKPMLDLNPLARLMSLYRSALLDGHVPVADLFVFAGMAFIAFLAGFACITRLKPLFADYV
jgi:lipopolysaccharide transport system permease protein